jgi:uncharacterized membrane protein YbhN (UPF0104 family)
VAAHDAIDVDDPPQRSPERGDRPADQTDRLPSSSRWIRVLGIVVSLASLAAVVWWAAGQEAPRLPTTGPRLAALAAAVALYLVAAALRGERWQALLRHNGASPSRADTWSLVAVGYMGNTVLPARAGDAFRVVFLTSRARTDARTVLGTLLVERLLDVAVLGAAFVVLATFAFSGAGLPSGRWLALALGVVVIAVVVVALAVVVVHRRGHLERVWRAIAPVVVTVVRLRGRHGAAMLALTVVVWGVEAAVWWLTGEAAGLGLGPVEACYLLALASMFALIPSGPGYAGTMDAAIVFGTRVLDRAASAAVAYLLLLRFVLFVPITLLGLVLLVTRYGGLGRLRAARAGA